MILYQTHEIQILHTYTQKGRYFEFINMEKTPTFQENMKQLYSLKQELIRLNCIFSPEVVNYPQLNVIGELRKQLVKCQQNSQREGNDIKNVKAVLQEKLRETEKEKEELAEVNLQLVQSNQKMVKQLQALSHRLQKTAQELQQEKRINAEKDGKFAREIENLKLMHTQQLYILKKKDRKGH